MNRVTENNFYEEENYNLVLKVYIFVEGEGGGELLPFGKNITPRVVNP